MLASSLLTLLAAGVSMVAAQYPTDDSTTTSTMTMTQTLTITKCNPAHSDCPAYSATATAAVYPVYNTTSSYCPTDVPTTPVYPVYPTYGETSVEAVTPTYKSTPTTVVVSGASNLFAQSGLLLGAVAAGVALLA